MLNYLQRTIVCRWLRLRTSSVAVGLFSPCSPTKFPGRTQKSRDQGRQSAQDRPQLLHHQHSACPLRLLNTLRIRINVAKGKIKESQRFEHAREGLTHRRRTWAYTTPTGLRDKTCWRCDNGRESTSESPTAAIVPRNFCMRSAKRLRYPRNTCNPTSIRVAHIHANRRRGVYQPMLHLGHP